MRRYAFVFPLAFVLSLNIYFRTFTVNFPQFEIYAENTVNKRLYQDIIRQVNSDFPQFDIQAKDRLVSERLSQYQRKNKQQIEQMVEDEYLKLKGPYQDSRGQTYLMELDCWNWARYVDNVLRLGHPGDEVINGRDIDALMLAPLGAPLAWNKFLFYASAFLYRVFSFIKPVELNTFLFYLPLFFISIFVVVLYFLCLSRWGNLSAVISCLYVGLAPIFLPRSVAGWFDTDILNLLFPLLIVWTYLIAYEKAGLKSAVIYIFFSAFWLGLFCFTWINWWFILCIIVLYEVISLAGLLFRRLRDKEKDPILLKRHFFCLGCFLAFSFIWIVIFSGPQPLFDIFGSIKGAINLNKPLASLVWPNIYSTVDELRKSSLYEIVNQAGGIPLFVSGACCLSLLFWRHLRNQECAVFESGLRLILPLWFLSMFFASSRGIRFIMFTLIPLGVALGWILNEAYNYLGSVKRYLRNIPLIICVILAAKMFNNAAESAAKSFPLMNDTYYKMLAAIKGRTPASSIINAWWDYGDWYKSVSKRRVVIDGQSQNVPQTYWMARALLSDNEEEAIRILKMLDNGGNRAFELINAYFRDPLKAFFVLNKILSSNSKEAQDLMSKSFPRPLALRLTELILGRPQAEGYFVADYNTSNIIRSISFIGNWDFRKSYLAHYVNRERKEKIRRRLSGFFKDKREIESLYRQAGLVPKDGLGRWVSSSWSFRSGLTKGRKNNGIVLFDNGLVYDIKKKEAFLHTSQDSEYKIPRSLFFLENNILKEVVYPRPDLDYSVLILSEQDGFGAILLDTQLAKSLFVRLYFFNGAGLKHFKPFIEERLGDGYIRVFKINWG